VSGPLGKLAAYFRNEIPLGAEDMVRLAAAARASGLRWPAIALACTPFAGGDEGDEAAAAAAVMRVFRDVQHAAGVIAADESRLSPLAWLCPGCGQQVTDVAPDGRPVHVEAGHGGGCERLARDQASDDGERRARVPRLVAWSEVPPAGSLQRHRLARPFTDWCPRCGWHGDLDGWAATVSGDWTRVVCDDCWADLNPAVTVTVTFYACSARPGALGAPFAVIRRRERSDHGPPGAAQAMTWEPFWQWTPLLARKARGAADDCDIRQVSQDTAERVIRSLIGRRWPQSALTLPWTASAYPAGTAGRGA
jgi:hypothetical protein